jgi:V8-like Glu-specific endopeptidase
LGWWGSTSAGAGTEIRALSRTYLQNLIVNVGGYPKDKNHIPQCAYDVINNSSPTVNGTSIPELITYLVDTKDGQSGSPVWRYWKDSGKRCMVAVHHGSCIDVMDGCKTSTGGRPTSNTGVLITTDVLNQINAWKQQM